MVTLPRIETISSADMSGGVAITSSNSSTELVPTQCTISKIISEGLPQSWRPIDGM